MKKMKTKFILVFIAIMLVVGVFNLNNVNAEGNVAKILDGGEYATLTEAIVAATNGQTIILLQNVNESIVIPSDKNITLDLATYKITNIAGSHTITNRGTLTIKGSGTIDNISHAKAAVLNYGTATIQANVTVTRSQEAGAGANNSGGNSYYTIFNSGASSNMTISGATVYNKGCFSSMIRNDGVLRITEGTFTGGINTIKNDDGGKLYISGGSFTNTSQAPIMNANYAEISGGIFNQGTTAYSCILSYSEGANTACKGETIISGGTFNGEYLVMQHSSSTSSDGITKISNGIFNITSNLMKPTSSANNITIEITGGKYDNAVSNNLSNYYPTTATGNGYAEYETADGNYIVTNDRVILNSSDITTNVGDTVAPTITAKVNGISVSTAGLTIVSGNPGIAKVNANGTITGVSEGNTTLDLSLNGTTIQVAVTVSKNTPSEEEIIENEEEKIQANKQEANNGKEEVNTGDYIYLVLTILIIVIIANIAYIKFKKVK